MATVVEAAVGGRSLQGPEVKEALQRLRQTDNVTNWWYLIRTYLFLTLVIGAAVWFDLARQAADWSWGWSVPVFAVAIILIGAGQHQLSGLAHEGVHHILFQNRMLNEFVSDWFCLFPLYSSTHHYRLQHLAHHQFVNDPDRDPDISQLQTSGHWLNFPVTQAQFLAELFRQLLIVPLVRFILIRAQYNATGTDKNPYMRKGVQQPKIAVRVGMLYLFSMIGVLAWLVYTQDVVLLAIIPNAMWLVAMVFYSFLPESSYHQSRLHPVISQKVMTLLRITFLTLVFGSLAWITVLTGVHAWAYYGLLWLVPIFTSFSFYMIMRQWVQHGNGGRAWLTNTRTFFVGPFINYAVFPMGQDYHLPHHLYATVPHYRLQELHELLIQCPEYRDGSLEVHGYFTSPESPQVHPTVIDVLGPAYAPREGQATYLDHSVLDDCEVEDKEAIIAEGAPRREA
jgi:fatty acid desaturase